MDWLYNRDFFCSLIYILGIQLGRIFINKNCLYKMMKTSKQILLITLILFIFFASGCSKNFFGRDDARPDSNIFGMAGDLEEIEEKSGGVDSSSGRDDKTGLDQKVGAAEQGVPGNGASGSFSAEPFAGEGEGLRIDGSDTKETPEPFLTEKGEDMVASLPHDEQARRSLPYHPIDHLTDIHFAFDKYDLDDKSRAILQENVAYLKTHPASRIEIRGHCDERGSNSYNISLGERRAQSTKSYLTSLGVDASRIRTISYGEERPFCFESNEACWYQNRRAHFLVAD